MLSGELIRDEDEDDDAGDVTPSLATIAAAEALLNQPPSPPPSSSSDSEAEPEETSAGEGSGAGGEVSVSPDTDVSVVPGVPRYHRPDCILIRFMGVEDLESKTIQDAADSGCTPCRACQPEVDSPSE
jgi:hypothetical protein